MGVYAVKWAEEKARKDKLWKIEATIKDPEDANFCSHLLEINDIPFNYVDIRKYTLFNCYCATSVESKKVKTIFEMCNAKYFASEGKEL